MMNDWKFGALHSHVLSFYPACMCKGLSDWFCLSICYLMTSHSGARKRGILGVFTGLGKGAVGLFLRPATGLLDLTSATLTVVQK